MTSTLFTNCKIWQPDGSFSEAFGIHGNRFDFVGTNYDANLISSHYQKIADLNNKLVLPGFIDSHVHLVHGSLTRKRIDCSYITNLTDLKKAVYTYKKKNPGIKWIIGGGLNGNLFVNEGALFLDEVENKLPLFIGNFDYHSGFCNSKALELSGLIQKTADFSADEIPIDTSGSPTGVVKEKAMEFIFQNLPEPSLNEKCIAVTEVIKQMHTYGITSIGDITLEENLEVYTKLHSMGKLDLRIASYLTIESVDESNKFTEFTELIDSSNFKIQGFKAYYDGALGSETALFKENYLYKDNNGYKTDIANSGLLDELCLRADNMKKQIIIHAIGDKAVSGVLDIYEELENINGKRNRRHRIEHAQHIDENDFVRFIKTGTIPSVQPLHMKYDIPLALTKLPEKIIKRTHNYKALIDNGVNVAFGTDYPIVEINPFFTIQHAVTRKVDDKVFLPEYKINLHECIKAYTINGAYASFSENQTGSISVGKFADFIVMEDDLFKMDEDEISKARVLMTYFDGRFVYENV
jgi:hypothetical protein